MRVSTLCTLSVIKLRHQMFDNIFSTHVTHHSVQMSCKAAARLFARPYMRHATLPRVLVHFSTYVMPRRCTFSFTSPHKITHRCYFALPHTCGATLLPAHLALPYHATSCHVAARFLTLLHIRHAMLPHVQLHFSTYVMHCCCTFSCVSVPTHATPLRLLRTSVHTSCYGAARSLTLMPHVGSHLSTYVMLRCRTSTGTSPHTSCYAATRSLALLHVCHVPLLYVCLLRKLVPRQARSGNMSAFGNGAG